MLKLENIKKSYTIGKEKETILKEINLTFEKGGLVSLLGPSGSGKSTILNIIGGLDTPDSGNLIFKEKNTSDYKEKDWDKYRKNHVGFIFQNFNLVPHLTALENVEITMTLSGLGKKEKKEKAEKLLELVGLKERMHHKPNELSGGQKQRVAIARALSNEPDIILADEPTGALDSETADSIVALLKQIADSGKLVIVVTHSKELSEQTDRVIEMKDGKIIRDVTNVDREEKTEEKEEKPFFRLPYKTTVKLAWRNLWKKKWRTILTSLGASIGIGGVVLMLAIGNGAQEKLKKEISIINLKGMQVTVDKKGEKAFKNSDIDKMAEIKGVEKVAADYVFLSNIKFKNKSSQSALGISMDPEAEKGSIIEGRDVEKKNEVTLTKKQAQELVGKKANVKSLLNKEVKVRLQLYDGKNMYKTINEKVKVVGILKDQMFGSAYGLISIEYSKELAKKSAGNELKNVTIDVLAKTVDDVPKVKKELKTHKWYVTTNEEAIAQVQGYVVAIQAVLALFAGISLVVSSIMIGIVLYISVLERTKEIGILKAVGARRKDIRRIFLSEAAVIGFLGGALGVVGASIAGTIVNIVVKNVLKENAFQVFIMPFWLVVSAIVFSTVVSVIAGYIPSRKASKLKAIDALRYE